MGPLFVDLGTVVRGPVEFDLAHAPDDISEHYPGIDEDLLGDCRILMLAMVTTWRWNRTTSSRTGPGSPRSGWPRCARRSIAAGSIRRPDPRT
jgi:hypothetical protein